jgi:hypothetical protein
MPNSHTLTYWLSILSMTIEFVHFIIFNKLSEIGFFFYFPSNMYDDLSIACKNRCHIVRASSFPNRDTYVNWWMVQSNSVKEEERIFANHLYFYISAGDHIVTSSVLKIFRSVCRCKCKPCHSDHQQWSIRKKTNKKLSCGVACHQRNYRLVRRFSSLSLSLCIEMYIECTVRIYWGKVNRNFCFFRSLAILCVLYFHRYCGKKKKKISIIIRMQLIDFWNFYLNKSI